MASVICIKTGEKFGRLTVLGRAENSRDGAVRWRCRCECGQGIEVRSKYLRNGKTRSCGCLRAELVSARRLKHGQAKANTKEYVAWSSMLKRCSDAAGKDYADYRGRGISVCRRWKKFENFFADLGPAPTSLHSLDRIDNNGNYEPGNCRWAIRQQQARNRRNNLLITYRGETLILGDWAKRLGINRQTLISRIKRGLSVEEAFTKPIGRWSDVA